MKKNKKISFLAIVIILLLVAMPLLTACPGNQTETELHEWHGGINRWRITGIIYEVRSKPAEISGKTLLWNPGDVQLDLYFGRDASFDKDYYLKAEEIGVVCFAAYFFWTGNGCTDEYMHKDFDDYMNPPDAIFLTKISVEEFLSQKYEAKYGANTNPLYPKQPVFDELHEPLIVTVPQEVFQKSEELPDDGYGAHSFRFGVVPVHFSTESNSYGFGNPGFGKESDGLTFFYKNHESGKISIGCR